MTARAAAAAATGQRILEAAVELFMEQFWDQVTLDEVAERAKVTVQTVIRRFGGKDGVLRAAVADANERALRQRDEAPVGDLRGAVRNVMDDYEEWGDRLIRALAQEDRLPALSPFLEEGRKYHYRWVERVFAPWLVQRDAPERMRLRATLIAVCDVYVWKLLRRDLGLSRKQTEDALVTLIGARLGEGKPGGGKP
jgi:AcrR family transcriptional regulator